MRRHPLRWIALALVVISASATTGVMAWTLWRRPGDGIVDVAVIAVSALILLAWVHAPAAAMLLVGWRADARPAATWSLLIGAAIFAPVNLALNADVLLTDSSTAVLGYLWYTPVLAGLVGLTWALTRRPSLPVGARP